jgi:hypothetical protein
LNADLVRELSVEFQVQRTVHRKVLVVADENAARNAAAFFDAAHAEDVRVHFGGNVFEGIGAFAAWRSEQRRIFVAERPREHQRHYAVARSERVLRGAVGVCGRVQKQPRTIGIQCIAGGFHHGVSGPKAKAARRDAQRVQRERITLPRDVPHAAIVLLLRMHAQCGPQGQRGQKGPKVHGNLHVKHRTKYAGGG